MSGGSIRTSGNLLPGEVTTAKSLDRRAEWGGKGGDSARASSETATRGQTNGLQGESRFLRHKRPSLS